MAEVRPATLADVELVTAIAAAGFHDDPVMSWAMPDPERRRRQLPVMFGGLAADVLADRGHVVLADEASACIWRAPDFDHEGAADAGERAEAVAEVFDADELARLAVFGAAMHEAHPSEAHWYLNVVATLPTERSRGLGAAVLAPIIARADADGLPCYLESTNPRNHSLYHRHGFEDMGDIHLDDGVSMRQMWRPAIPYSR